MPNAYVQHTRSFLAVNAQRALKCQTKHSHRSWVRINIQLEEQEKLFWTAGLLQ